MKKLFIPIILVCASFTLHAQNKPVVHQPSAQKVITLKLNIDQINLILNSLADRKLSESIDTYMTVRMQSLSQLTDSTDIDIKTDSSKPVAKNPKPKKN